MRSDRGRSRPFRRIRLYVDGASHRRATATAVPMKPSQSAAPRTAMSGAKPREYAVTRNMTATTLEATNSQANDAHHTPTRYAPPRIKRNIPDCAGKNVGPS